jgi:hypothetical protein
MALGRILARIPVHLVSLPGLFYYRRETGLGTSSPGVKMAGRRGPAAPIAWGGKPRMATG